MANGQHGGYRRPANPAPVSGPGKYSKRTDGGPAQVISTVPDLPYGEAGQQQADQSIAPMAGTAPLPTPPSGQDVANAGPTYQGGDFAAPSTRPDEPVTHGLPIGDGAGPEATAFGPGAQMAPVTGSMTQLLGRLQATDMTGVLAKLYEQAAARGV